MKVDIYAKLLPSNENTRPGNPLHRPIEFQILNSDDGGCICRPGTLLREAGHIYIALAANRVADIAPDLLIGFCDKLIAEEKAELLNYELTEQALNRIKRVLAKGY